MKDIQDNFYPLQHEEWLKICKELQPSERDVLYYLRTLDSDLEGIRLSVSVIAHDLSTTKKKVHKSTVSRALKVLDEKGLLPQWCKNHFLRNSQNNTEATIRNRMKEELNGAVEVITAVGRIDLLTSTEIIEIKEINDWKEALGQILAYSSFFPEHSKRIHLFGRLDLSKLALAQATCKEFNITVTFEEV